MTKAVLQLGYDQYVLDAQDALKVYEIIAKAERYKSMYRSREEGGSVHYVWDQGEEREMRDLRIMPDSLYRMAKLAGKPDQDS